MRRVTDAASDRPEPARLQWSKARVGRAMAHPLTRADLDEALRKLLLEKMHLRRFGQIGTECDNIRVFLPRLRQPFALLAQGGDFKRNALLLFL